MQKTVIRNDPDKTEKAFSYLATSTYSVYLCPKSMYRSDKLADYCSHGRCDAL